MKKFPLFHKMIATSFGFGYWPWGPGTAGAVFAVIVWIALYYGLAQDYAMIQSVLAALIVVFTILGVWSGTVAERFWGPDPSKVVMDETVGCWIGLLAVPQQGQIWWYVLGAFVLFRFFDIVKPLGVRQMEKFPGGYGIMADDILAGVYSAIVLVIANLIL